MQHRKLRLPLGAIIIALGIVGVIFAQRLYEEGRLTWYKVIRVAKFAQVVDQADAAGRGRSRSGRFSRTGTVA